jgi:hypothetical protein
MALSPNLARGRPLRLPVQPTPSVVRARPCRLDEGIIPALETAWISGSKNPGEARECYRSKPSPGGGTSHESYARMASVTERFPRSPTSAFRHISLGRHPWAQTRGPREPSTRASRPVGWPGLRPAMTAEGWERSHRVLLPKTERVLFPPQHRHSTRSGSIILRGNAIARFFVRIDARMVSRPRKMTLP